jgi:hypothetical protein
MLDPDGVVMTGYANIPYLRGVGAEIGQDIDYWAINDRTKPTIFVSSRGAVDDAGCISISPAYVSPDRLPSSQVCGLIRDVGGDGCTTYRFSDATYGSGVVAISDVNLRWRLPFEEQARVGDCIVDAVEASIGGARINASAWRALVDYVGARRGPP